MKKVVFALLLACVLVGCQSRILSRYGGKPLVLELPADFAEPISFSSGRDGEKDLFYFAKDGTMRVKTYSDFGVFEAEIVFFGGE